MTRILDFTLRAAPTALLRGATLRKVSLAATWEMDGADGTECSQPGRRGRWPGEGGEQRAGRGAAGRALRSRLRVPGSGRPCGMPTPVPRPAPSPRPTNPGAWNSQTFRFPISPIGRGDCRTQSQPETQAEVCFGFLDKRDHWSWSRAFFLPCTRPRGQTCGSRLAKMRQRVWDESQLAHDRGAERQEVWGPDTVGAERQDGSLG